MRFSNDANILSAVCTLLRFVAKYESVGHKCERLDFFGNLQFNLEFELISTRMPDQQFSVPPM